MYKYIQLNDELIFMQSGIKNSIIDIMKIYIGLKNVQVYFGLDSDTSILLT